jgi:hypothetical protein
VVIEKKNIFVNMNSKNSIILVDPDFDISSTSEFDLLIKVTSDNFSYAIIDVLANRLVVLYDQQECENVIAALSDVLANDKYLGHSFKTTKASVYTPNSIAIPNELFDAENLNSYAKFFSIDQSEQLHLQSLNGQPYTSIFNLNHAMEELLITKFGISKIYDHTAPLLAIANVTSNKQLTLDFTVGAFCAVLTDNGKLIFENCFETEDSEEFNYYLLLIIQQLNVETTTTLVSVSGIIHEDDKKYHAIKQSFPEVVFTDQHHQLLDVSILEDMPKQYYTSLLALQSCE